MLSKCLLFGRLTWPCARDCMGYNHNPHYLCLNLYPLLYVKVLTLKAFYYLPYLSNLSPQNSLALIFHSSQADLFPEYTLLTPGLKPFLVLFLFLGEPKSFPSFKFYPSYPLMPQGFCSCSCTQ